MWCVCVPNSHGIVDRWHIIYYNWKLKYQSIQRTICRYHSKRCYFSFSIPDIGRKCYYFCFWHRARVKTIAKDKLIEEEPIFLYFYA